MALGYDTNGDDAEKAPVADNGYYDGDVEAGARDTKGRKMSRIDRPVTKSIAGVAGSDADTDVSVSVGKQMELEAGNAIKYRTCSWQKV